MIKHLPARDLYRLTPLPAPEAGVTYTAITNPQSDHSFDCCYGHALIRPSNFTDARS